MPGSGRPPPPLTLVVPGREATPDLLGPPDRPPYDLPLRLRALLLVVVAVLSTGVLVSLERGDPSRPDPVPADDAPAVLGVSAQVGLVALEPFLAVLDVAVTVAPGRSGPEDNAGRAAPRLTLREVGGRGLAVRLLHRSPPLLLGHLGRFAAATERVVHLPAQVVVSDCRSGSAAAPALVLEVQRADGPAHTVLALGDPTTSRALALLVRRTCRG